MKAKPSYSEQLRRPEWQRVRLQVLEAADWKCQACGCADKMLHVHHKQYIKGRLAWEYELSNFESLCEACHAEAHESKDLVLEILAALPTQIWMSAASLLSGWANEYVDEEISSRVYDAHAEEIGNLAWVASDMSIHHVMELSAAVKKSIVSGLPLVVASHEV